MALPYKSNVQNYKGVFDSTKEYDKFDFVVNPDNSLFYYATDSIPAGSSLEYEGQGVLFYKIDLQKIAQHFNVRRIDEVIFRDVNGNDMYYSALNNMLDDFKSGELEIYADQYDRLPGNGSIDFSGINVTRVFLGQDYFKTISPSQLWVKDYFFFDSDYGARVSFKINNDRVTFGNGYVFSQPKDINSLTCEIDLVFKNRTNKESNAIVHFLENHPGSQEERVQALTLAYTQGIKGFYWGGNSIFHPYDSPEMQIKTFYCDEFSRNLKFENNNDVSVKLKNFNTSLMNKSESLYVKKADSYSQYKVYSKNDVVFFPPNHQYYYCVSDVNVNNVAPAVKNESWSRDGGQYRDVNKNVWSRYFFWKPSVTLNINTKIRDKKISMGGSYTQVYKDGINETLLNIDLEFNNRDDRECYAILHFLESHFGSKPFQFSLPSPYEGLKSFVCEKWEHVYNYRNNHSIKASFSQVALNLSASFFDSSRITQSTGGSAAYLSVVRNIVMRDETSPGEFEYSEKLRHRLSLRNGGGSPLTIDSLELIASEIRGVDLKFLGQNGNNIPIIPGNISNRAIKIQSGDPNLLPFGLVGKKIVIGKSSTNGVDGGYSFSCEGKEYFQKNNGVIISREPVSGNSAVACDYFLMDMLIKNRKNNVINPGQTSYIDILFSGMTKSQLSANLLGEDNADGIYNITESDRNLPFEANAVGAYFYSTLRISSDSYYNNGLDDVEIQIYLDT